MADAWLGISSSEYDSHCGDDGTNTIEKALDGTSHWAHAVEEIHWFILDLGKQYTIKKVRGRSEEVLDPTDVDIYVSNSKTVWGDAVATGISTWKNTKEWVVIDSTDKIGRYIKVVVNATEIGAGFAVYWGDVPAISIFDAYGSPAARKRRGRIIKPRIGVKVGN